MARSTFGNRNVRAACEGDAAACAAIYAPYVTDTAITFELAPPSSAEMAERIAAATCSHAWLVLEDGSSVGYAYGGTFNVRPAYRWPASSSAFAARPQGWASGAGRPPAAFSNEQV